MNEESRNGNRDGTYMVHRITNEMAHVQTDCDIMCTDAAAELKFSKKGAEDLHTCH